MATKNTEKKIKYKEFLDGYSISNGKTNINRSISRFLNFQTEFSISSETHYKG